MKREVLPRVSTFLQPLLSQWREQGKDSTTCIFLPWYMSAHERQKLYYFKFCYLLKEIKWVEIHPSKIQLYCGSCFRIQQGLPGSGTSGGSPRAGKAASWQLQQCGSKGIWGASPWVRVGTVGFMGFLHKSAIEEFVKYEYFVCSRSIDIKLFLCYPAYFSGVARNGNEKLLTWAWVFFLEEAVMLE